MTSAAPSPGINPTPALEATAQDRSLGSGDDVEKATGFRARGRERMARMKTRVHHFSKDRWFMIGLITFFVISLLVLFLSIFLTVGDPRWGYREWERQHAYDSPVCEAISSNFPDPAVLIYKNVQYAFATNNAAGILLRPENASDLGYGMANIQLGVSMDKWGSWTVRQPAEQPLAHVGAWTDLGMTNKTKALPAISRAQGWSPGITQRKSDKRFVLYYAAASTPQPSRRHPTHCIGAAVSQSKSPLGPYQPLDKPLVCDFEYGGAIDPSPFRDKGGAIWLAYKIDGNNVGHGGACGNTVEPIMPTPIMLQRMLKDGVTPDGPPVQIFDRDDSDGPLVEAPNIVRSKEGIYFLFYSSGCTRESSYDIRYATAEDVTGPYVRASKTLLKTGDWGLVAPGSPSVVKNPYDRGYIIAFHSRKHTAEGRVRAMSWSKLYLDGRHARLVNQVELHRIGMRPE